MVNVHKTPNGTKITYEELQQMIKKYTILDVAQKLGYQSRTSIRRLVTEVFGKQWNSKVSRCKVSSNKKGYKEYETANGTKVTLNSLTEMLKKHSLRKVASDLGYQSTTIIRVIYEDRLDGTWSDVREGRPKMKYIKGVAVWTTPNGTEVTCAEVQDMAVTSTLDEVAEALGYYSGASVIKMVKNVFKEEWNPKRAPSRLLDPKASTKTCITPNGKRITYKQLQNLIKNNTIKEVAKKLGYQNRSSIRNLVEDGFGEQWEKKNHYGNQEVTTRSDGTKEYKTPNDTIIDMDLLNAMLSNDTMINVAKKLGYKSLMSIYDLSYKLEGKINRKLETITQFDEKVLFEIHYFTLENRYAPSLKDLSEQLEVNERTIASRTEFLTEKKLLKRAGAQSGRSLHLTKEAISRLFGEEYFDLEKQLLNFCLCATEDSLL